MIVCRYRMMLFSSHNPEQSNSAMLLFKLFLFLNDFCLCLKTLTWINSMRLYFELLRKTTTIGIFPKFPTNGRCVVSNVSCTHSRRIFEFLILDSAICFDQNLWYIQTDIIWDILTYKLIRICFLPRYSTYFC